MNTTAAGKRALRRVMDCLTADGYTLVESHISRGPADLMAAKAGQVLAVQVKRSLGGSPRPDEWNALIDHAQAFGAVPVVAIAAPRRPVVYWQVLGRKDGSGRRQPWARFYLDEVEAAS